MRLMVANWSILASLFGALVVIAQASAQDSSGLIALPPPGWIAPPPFPNLPLPNAVPPNTETPFDNQLSAAPAPLHPIPLEVPMWYEPAYWFGAAPWDIGFELGLNGSEGINETLSLRAGGHLRRETEFWKFDTSLAYNKNTANNLETQNNALLDVRVDRLLGKSPWTLYFLNQELYDEFQAFDLRVSLNAGVGYRLIDGQSVELLGRLGAGTSREFGGPDDSWAQEALFGLDYEHELSKTQRLTATVDYYPEWKDFGLYRLVTDVGWEIDLDQPKNLSLKLSLIDRYDSTPNGAEPNAFDYAALLIWGL